MRETTGIVVEELCIAKCSQCAVYVRGLSQAEALKFRDVDHLKHEGVMLGLQEPPPVPVGFDPVPAAARLDGSNQAMKMAWLSVDAVIRPISGTYESEVARLTTWKGLSLRDYEQQAVLVAGPVIDLESRLDAALVLLREVGPSVRAAMEAFRSQPARASAPPSSIHELVADRDSQHERDLVAVAGALDRLEQAVGFYAPELAKAKRAADLFLRALVAVLRTAQVGWAGDRVAWLKLELEKLRWPVPEEERIVKLLTQLGGDLGAEVPILSWPKDVLAAPELT